MAHTERSLLARFLFWYGGRSPSGERLLCHFYPKGRNIQKTVVVNPFF